MSTAVTPSLRTSPTLDSVQGIHLSWVNQSVSLCLCSQTVFHKHMLKKTLHTSMQQTDIDMEYLRGAPWLQEVPTMQLHLGGAPQLPPTTSPLDSVGPHGRADPACLPAGTNADVIKSGLCCTKQLMLENPM